MCEAIFLRWTNDINRTAHEHADAAGVRAATEISLQHTPRHMQHSPHDNTWDRKVPDTVTLQLLQKLALLQGRVSINKSLQIILQNKYQLH